jgi:hypothetical protein
MLEPNLPFDLRQHGAQVLLYHDVLEDTTAKLPDWLSNSVKADVKLMTFPGGFAQEQVALWSRPDHILLFKLYDKVSNLLDSSWMSADKYTQYLAHTQRLASQIESQYGTLAILPLCRDKNQ